MLPWRWLFWTASPATIGSITETEKENERERGQGRGRKFGEEGGWKQLFQFYLTTLKCEGDVGVLSRQTLMQK